MKSLKRRSTDLIIDWEMKAMDYKSELVFWKRLSIFLLIMTSITLVQKYTL